MKVKDLIKELKKCNQNYEVAVYDTEYSECCDPNPEDSYGFLMLALGEERKDLTNLWDKGIVVQTGSERGEK